MVDSGVIKGENAIVAYTGAENAIKEVLTAYENPTKSKEID